MAGADSANKNNLCGVSGSFALAVTYRVCNRCKETKLIAMFGKNKWAKDGKHVTCRLCLKVADQLRRDKYVIGSVRR